MLGCANQPCQPQIMPTPGQSLSEGHPPPPPVDVQPVWALYSVWVGADLRREEKWFRDGMPKSFAWAERGEQGFLELVAESGRGCSGLRAGRKGVWGWRCYSGRSKSWGLWDDNHNTERGQAGGLEIKAPSLRLCLNFLWGHPCFFPQPQLFLASKQDTHKSLPRSSHPFFFFFYCRKQSNPCCIFSSNLHGFG